VALRARQPGWADVLEEHGIDEATCARLVSQLRSSEVAALAFCRLLERWARGDASPATAGGREAALRHAAERVETALTGLEEPLAQYLLELHEGTAEGRSWYGGPGAAELIEWGPVLLRAGVQASALRVAQSYLELAVFVRALEGLATAARFESGVERASLWAGLFDLRENLLGRGLEDLRALAA
jgi:hypothetical protein